MVPLFQPGLLEPSTPFLGCLLPFRPQASTAALPPLGVMTLFYRGLLELSKSFLDPFGNKRVSSKFMAADLEVDVLLAESNAGSLVWPQVGARASAHPHETLTHTHEATRREGVTP